MFLTKQRSEEYAVLSEIFTSEPNPCPNTVAADMTMTAKRINGNCFFIMER